MQVLTPEAREEILKQYRNHSKELVKLQREYKSLLGTPVLSKVENIKRTNFLKNLQQLEKEKEEILSNLQVALGKVHLQEYESHIKTIKAHVCCQERLQEEIDLLYTNIDHLVHQQLKADQEIYKLNFKATSEAQYNETVKKAKSNLEILENQLDVSKKRECSLITENMRLRNLIVDMLYDRSLFNKLWHRMMTHLNHDKKFLIDLVERAIDCFEEGTEICQKLDSIQSKKNRDVETKIVEMQELIKRGHADKYNMKFLLAKGKNRELADLEAREYKRREIFKVSHMKKISLYKAILDKILSFSGVETITEAIEKFQKQEDVFYSYFNYMNELSYQVQVLDNCLNDLYQGIIARRTVNVVSEQFEKNKIKELEKQLAAEEQKTKEKEKEKDAYDKELENLFTGLHDVFTLLQCDDAPLMALLGDHSKITIFNVERFLEIFEKQLNSVIAFVYMNERKHKVRSDRLTVRNVERLIENPTPIENIVLTQQCAECAEGEDVNPYDEEFVMPKTMEEVKVHLREKVMQPEMQYRLHSISQCRLPRSRLLANKRY
ncbi:uncharacterized protein LOC119659790 [Hermetia illucens]|nr:uncharacterized protein LOC119659790 [Hermetia illucens]